MSGKVPFFLTGASAKILLNGKTVAFATDVSYRVTVRHASPRLLGKYEVEEHQPLAYDVSGSMTLIRYARGIDKFLGGSVAAANEQGNGIGSFGQDGGTLGIKKALGLPSSGGEFDGNADEALNPGRFFQSKSFDIEIRQVLPKSKQGDIYSLNPERTVRNLLAVADDLAFRDRTSPGNNETTVVLLRGCRISDMGFSLSRRGVATQQLSFLAQYADDDTMIARTSGVGQELS